MVNAGYDSPLVRVEVANLTQTSLVIVAGLTGEFAEADLSFADPLGDLEKLWTSSGETWATLSSGRVVGAAYLMSEIGAAMGRILRLEIFDQGNLGQIVGAMLATNVWLRGD
jgi:hypothetical protein